ncbi:MAG: acyl-CoA dehydrogenase family protein [Pseudomonadota bacterium]
MPLSTIQTAPRLGNQFHDDWLLQGWLRCRVPDEMLQEHISALETLGAEAGDRLYRMQLADRENEPRLTQWNAWGERIDHIGLTSVWQHAQQLAAELGLIATGYDRTLGEHARSLQFARAWLFIPSTDFYGCPLAMTDGAARVLTNAGNEALAQRALPHLLSRDPAKFWTSGQWMTETIGGSDVSQTETIARQDENGQWRLYGRKWFTSAATSEMALTLARPDGQPTGSRGLALFYLEPRDTQGRLQQIEVLRLKDKLGTRKLPTAELWLNGAPAEPVAGLERGVAQIAPMLNITRSWNAITACTLMRRGLALATDYAHRRKAFGHTLIDLPLHRRTLTDLHADWAAASAATLDMIALLGQVEQRDEPDQARLLRLLTPVIKLGSARDAIAILSEVLESFGGAGYIEDTGLPQLLRDAQVLSIWEGTTNILALDLLRAMDRVGLESWLATQRQALDEIRDEALIAIVERIRPLLQQLVNQFELDELCKIRNARALALNLYRLTALTSLTRLADQAQRRCNGATAVKLKAVALHFATVRMRLEPIERHIVDQALF